MKVRGTVQSGEYILPSGANDGTGVAVHRTEMTIERCTQVVGLALESSSQEAVGQTAVMVGLPKEEITASLLRARDTRIEALETRLTAIAKLLNVNHTDQVSRND